MNHNPNHHLHKDWHCHPNYSPQIVYEVENNRLQIGTIHQTSRAIFVLAVVSPGMLLIPGTGNGERGTGNGRLGTNVQRQPA